ncbi:hypothetical protein JCM8097_003480 [Rhodosporidiobolus ruineniae]
MSTQRQRPSLSISVGRRPSLLQTATANCASSSAASTPSSPLLPHTPQNASPALDGSYFPAPLQTPPLNGAANGLFPPNAYGFPGRRGMLRRNSSLSSVSSSVAGEEDDEDEPEWTEDEERQVQQIYDACLAKHARTQAPFAQNGPPPSNFTNMVARTVLRSQKASSSGRSARSKRPTFFAGEEAEESDASMEAGAKGWRHGMRSTRAKILSLAKARQTAELEATPRQSDPEATPKRRKPMVRQDSMDFLPDMRNASSISRLGNMLRQPSTDSSFSGAASALMAPSLSASGASTPPCAPSAFSHSCLGGTRPNLRLQRNNSLHSIAGSPSQPQKKPAAPTKGGMLAVPSSASGPGTAGLKRMARTGSESSVLPAPVPMARTLSFDPKQRNKAAERAPLGSGGVGAGLLTPPSSGKKPAPGFSFNSSPVKQPNFGLAPPSSLGGGKPNAGLSIDAAFAQSASSLKRPQGGLASAFHSPVVGAFGLPSPQSASPKKKKARVAAGSPVRQPVFGAAKEKKEGEDPLASGLGLGFGLAAGAMGEMRMQVDHPGLSRSPSPFALNNSSEDSTNRPTVGASSSFALLDPSSASKAYTLSPSSVSPCSFGDAFTAPAGAAEGTPLLVVTPSLSPSSSSSSLSSTALSLSSSSSTGTGCSTPASAIPSPLSAAFDLNALKLDSLTPPAAIGGEGAGTVPTDVSAGEAGFLNPEYVKAGREAQMLREHLGEFSWARS